MTNIILGINTPYEYDKETMTFRVSEKNVKFATEYKVSNPNTGNTKTFKFSHSTGPEFHPDTKWIYKTEDNKITLQVCNDLETTKKLAANYLAAKTR